MLAHALRLPPLTQAVASYWRQVGLSVSVDEVLRMWGSGGVVGVREFGVAALVIMSEPSCFPAFMRLLIAALSPVSCGIFCRSIWSMRSITGVSDVSFPSVKCMYSPGATPMYCAALRATAVACWYWSEG